MSLDNIVSVAITRVSGVVTQQGFSTPCILAYQTRRTSDRVHSYASTSEMEAHGYTPDDTAHKIATALWSQPNPPAAIKIGRRANAFTKSIRLTPTAADATVYAVELEGLEATYTSGASATVAQICTGLVAVMAALADADAIVTSLASSASPVTLSGASLTGASGYRALSPSRRITITTSSHADFDDTTVTITGKDAGGNTITDTVAIDNGGGTTNTSTKLFARVTSIAIPAQTGTGGSFTVGVAAPYAASDDTTHITLTAPAGLIPSLEITGEGVLALEDRTTDPGLAADLTAIRAEDDDWYCALLDSNSSAEILALAAILEPLTPKKILLAQSADTDVPDADSITDVAYLVADRDYFRTHVPFHPRIATSDSWIAAANVGSALAYDPGSVTWVNRELVGVGSWNPTSAQRTALLAKNSGSIETVAGRKITFGGKVGGGEWIDIIHGLDWLHARLGERLFGLIVSAADAKLGFTDKGIARVHAELRAQLKEASEAPYNLLNEGWTTSVPTAASLSSVQRATRTLPNVTWAATVQGAIHAVNIAGTVAA